MATKPAIPEVEHQDVLKWWSEGKSTRDIAESLKIQGIEVGHATVWRLIQRIGLSNGDIDVAGTVQTFRQQTKEDFDKLIDIENRIIRASGGGAETLDFEFTARGLKLLVVAHRMLLNRLKAQGVFGKLGERLHREMSHLWTEEDDGTGPYDEPVVRPAHHERVEAANSPPAVSPDADRELFHLKQEKPLETSETRRNSPPAVSPAANDRTAPATTGHDGPVPVSPSRTRPCPCKSGRKYKHCCGKDAPDAINLMRKSA